MVDNEETGRKVKNRENNIQAVPDEEAQRKAVRIAVGDAYDRGSPFKVVF